MSALQMPIFTSDGLQIRQNGRGTRLFATLTSSNLLALGNAIQRIFLLFFAFLSLIRNFASRNATFSRDEDPLTSALAAGSAGVLLPPGGQGEGGCLARDLPRLHRSDGAQEHLPSVPTTS